VKNDFISKFNRKINQIIKHPNSCPKSKEMGGIFKCVVTKQTTFYYRVNSEKQEIEIITLFDSRQDPGKLTIEME